MLQRQTHVHARRHGQSVSSCARLLLLLLLLLLLRGYQPSKPPLHNCAPKLCELATRGCV
jgi:hypothetical protein